jgi:hypothetical protein
MATFHLFENKSDLRPWKSKLSDESWNFQTFKLYYFDKYVKVLKPLMAIHLSTDYDSIELVLGRTTLGFISRPLDNSQLKFI